ncbi:hypothetical protein D1872_322980 [compost metagenome]
MVEIAINTDYNENVETFQSGVYCQFHCIRHELFIERQIERRVMTITNGMDWNGTHSTVAP